jgi:hypothetical protein
MRTFGLKALFALLVLNKTRRKRIDWGRLIFYFSNFVTIGLIALYVFGKVAGRFLIAGFSNLMRLPGTRGDSRSSHGVSGRQAHNHPTRRNRRYSAAQAITITLITVK